MTVAELIEELKMHPQDANVALLVSGVYWTIDRVRNVRDDRVAIVTNGGIFL